MRRRLPWDTSVEEKTSIAARFLFKEVGLQGNEAEYYDPRNSFLNEVVDRRLGIPIALSAIFLHVAGAVGLEAESRALVACTSYRGHALVVESEYDAFVPGQVIANYREALVGAASLTYRMLEGADHGLSEATAQQAYTGILVNWLREMIQGARANAQAAEIVAQELRGPAETA